MILFLPVFRPFNTILPKIHRETHDRLGRMDQTRPSVTSRSVPCWDPTTRRFTVGWGSASTDRPWERGVYVDDSSRVTDGPNTQSRSRDEGTVLSREGSGSLNDLFTGQYPPPRNPVLTPSMMVPRGHCSYSSELRTEERPLTPVRR